MSKEPEPPKEPRRARAIERLLTPAEEAALYGTTLIMVGSKPNPSDKQPKKAKK